MIDPNTGKFATSRRVLPSDRQDRDSRDIRLAEAWQAIVAGRGSKEDVELALADLGEFSGYFFVAESGTTGDQLLRNEGRRDVMARILFLLDVPIAYMTELRRAALDELTVTNENSG